MVTITKGCEWINLMGKKPKLWKKLKPWIAYSLGNPILESLGKPYSWVNIKIDPNYSWKQGLNTKDYRLSWMSLIELDTLTWILID